VAVEMNDSAAAVDCKIGSVAAVDAFRSSLVDLGILVAVHNIPFVVADTLDVVADTFVVAAAASLVAAVVVPFRPFDQAAFVVPADDASAVAAVVVAAVAVGNVVAAAEGVAVEFGCVAVGTVAAAVVGVAC
jgi:hypothetical protein